jgi:SnoaL-like domain
MSRMILTFFASMLLALPAFANDEDDLSQAITRFYAALGDNDFTRVDDFLLPEGFTEYSSRGGLKIDITVPLLKHLVENGLEAKVALQHIETFIYGDMGYATYYRIGTIGRPDTENAPAHTARVTAVWIKKQGSWYIKHIHNSKTGI